jgi:hypothetical protein
MQDSFTYDAMTAGCNELRVKTFVDKEDSSCAQTTFSSQVQTSFRSTRYFQSLFRIRHNAACEPDGDRV